MEGNFNNGFLLTMDDGNEVIAKIPCPNAGPPILTTASEVATLKFLRPRLSVRVPEVYAWSSDPANPVGEEFIIMEKIQGIALAETWESMNALERYRIIDCIVKMETELEALKLPSYGSLFLRDSLPAEYPRHALPSDLHPTGVFCVGPSCRRETSLQSDVRPWNSVLDFAVSMPHQELARTAGNGEEIQRGLIRFSAAQNVDEYHDLLQKVVSVLPILSRDPRVLEAARSVIWHTDLHLGNIYVCPDDPTMIEGLIDWQSAHAAPVFIQARFPEFLRPPKNYTPGTQIPKLPESFEELDSTQKESLLKDRVLAAQSKYYEMACLAYNKPNYNAMELDRRLWEPFTCSQVVSDGSMAPLRNCLVRLFHDWEGPILPGSCPFGFTEDELQKTREQVQHYQDTIYLSDIVKGQLRTDDTGWVSVGEWETIRKMNKHLFDMYLTTMADELPPEMASERWPFPLECA